MHSIQPIIVIATWSSGSTALAGFLDRCGAYTCPPHHRTSDDRTPSSFEPHFYADALRKLFDENTLQQQGEIKDFETFFEKFWMAECEKATAKGLHHVALKHPLQTFILPFLHDRLRPKYLFVTRPIAEIERTRTRRKWGKIFGEAGAQQVYSAATNFLVEHSCPYLAVPYNSLLNNIEFRKTILDFCTLNPTDAMLKAADSWLVDR